MKKDINMLIDKAIEHLEQIEKANSKIRFSTLQKFVSLCTDSKNKRFRNPYLITAITHIAWHSTNVGKIQEDV